MSCVDANSCDLFELAVYRNGESESVQELSLNQQICASRSAFEAAVSKAGCGSASRCEVRDGAGRVVRSCAELALMAVEGVQPPGLPRAYAVPRDKRFVFATEHVGFERAVPQVDVHLVTLAERPRLFEMRGFMSADDADRLIQDALAIEDNEHRLMRSSTGPKGYNPSSVRTSENAWVKDTPTAAKLKRRAFELLGFGRFDEGMADGLQVLRYNTSKAYVAHTDYLSQPAGVSREQMDPAVGGANRLATLFLYLSDVDEGGQTMFPNIPAPANAADPLQPRNALTDDIAIMRDQHAPNGWQRKMVDDCYSKLAVRPKKGRAILYYSQHPDGSLDPNSKHGGCPVLQGQKWAANLWVWNKIMPFGSSRFGDTKDRKNNKKGLPPDDHSIEATFSYRGYRDDVALYWNGRSKMGDFQPPTSSLNINTYDGHAFVAKTSHGRKLAAFRVSPQSHNFQFDDNGLLPG